MHRYEDRVHTSPRLATPCRAEPCPNPHRAVPHHTLPNLGLPCPASPNRTLLILRLQGPPGVRGGLRPDLARLALHMLLLLPLRPPRRLPPLETNDLAQELQALLDEGAADRAVGLARVEFEGLAQRDQLGHPHRVVQLADGEALEVARHQFTFPRSDRKNSRVARFSASTALSRAHASTQSSVGSLACSMWRSRDRHR